MQGGAEEESKATQRRQDISDKLKEKLQKEKDPYSMLFVVLPFKDGVEVVTVPHRNRGLLAKLPVPFDENQFPAVLHPLGVERVNVGIQPSVRLEFSCAVFDNLAWMHPTLVRLGIAWEPCCQLSPPTKITLSQEAKMQAHIPPEAAWFAWMYPAARMDDSWKHTEHSVEGMELQFSLLYNGGFVYFARSGELVAANAVMPGNALSFGPPIKWDKAFTRTLALEGRFQPITIKYLKDRGAMYFCWLNPGEKLRRTDEKGNAVEWIAPPHGGFVYLFGECYGKEEEPTDQDLVFPVVDEIVNPSRPVVNFDGSSGQPDSALLKCEGCRRKPRCVMFVQCNHVVYCEDCANGLERCPKCDTPIINRWNVFQP